MADLLSDNTDFEVSKYYDAQNFFDAGFNPAIEKNKKSVFNPETGLNEILTPMGNGGYVKIGEEEPEVMAEAPAQPAMPSGSEAAPAQAAAEEAKRLQEIQGSYSLDDLRAAGYTDEQISAAGLDVQPEPMTEQEIAQYISEGAPLVDADPTLRDQGAQIVSTYVFDAAVAGLRDELAEQGMGPEEIERTVKAREGELFREAEVYSNALFGTGATGYEVGLGDFLTAGAMDIQEGYRMFSQQRGEGGSMAGRAMGAGIMIAGIAEATGVGYAFGKLLKRGIKVLEPEIIRMGAEAEQRIANEGATLFSNPVGPIVDRGLAAAGRLVEGEKPSVDELRRQANIARFGYDPNDPVADVKVPTETEPGIIAFHGSGADFDEFKVEKIGTGEGAQAFGYGLYFTDKEDIAKFYRDSVGAGNEVTYKGKIIQDLDQDYADENNIAHMAGQQETPEDMQRVVTDEVRRARNNLAGIEQSIKDFEENPDVYPLKFHGMEISIEVAKDQQNFFQRRLDAALKVQDNIDEIKAKPAGRVYQVGLHVKPDELIDYDKTFDEQSPFVQQAILKVLNEIHIDDAVNMGFDVFSPPYNGNEEMALQATRQAMLDNFSVVRFLNDWSVLRGAENSGEELLEKHGVKGIKYKAQVGVGARNVPETGASNYVIFDDKLIDIMKKYGIVGPVAVTAMKSEEQEET